MERATDILLSIFFCLGGKRTEGFGETVVG